MTRPRSLFDAFVSSFLIALLSFAPGTVWAQGFDFGEEDAVDVDEAPPSDEEVGDGMVFDSDDLSADDVVETAEKPTVAVVAVPGPGVDRERRLAIQSAMMDFARNMTNIIPIGAESVLPALEQRDPQTCVTEPICLGAVGDAANANRLLIGRVKEGPAGLTLEVDYFNVDDRLFIRYHSSEPTSSTGGLVDAVEPALRDIFQIRDPSNDPNYVGEEDSSIVQDIVAWGAGGLAIVFLTTGVIFGMSASDANTELEETQLEDGTYSITQTDAQDRVRDAEGDATAANIFYGLAGAMAVTSVIFFIIKGGSDVAEDQRASLFHDLRVAPTFNASGAGIGAGFSF